MFCLDHPESNGNYQFGSAYLSLSGEIIRWYLNLNLE